MPAIKLCTKCSRKFKNAASRGGRNGSRADKLRASRLSVIARARNARKITLHGESRTIAEWSRITKIPKSTLWKRLGRDLPATLVLAR